MNSWDTEAYLRRLESLPDDQIFPVITHDLRGFAGNVLQSVAFIETIRDAETPQDNDDQTISDMLAVTKDSANYMMNVLDAILAYGQERARGGDPSQ